MTRLALATALSLMAAPILAGVPPMTFPDLTFPTPPTQPDVSTQGCIATVGSGPQCN